jgi:Bacterial Ig domain
MLSAMGRPKSAIRRLVLSGLIVAAAICGAAVATASVSDSGILNQTQFRDATGDSGGGPDLSSLTVTTYTDGTVSLSIQFANRAFLHPDETVQVFVDVNDDRRVDLNLSIWPTFNPSYLARWTGTSWQDIRQLAELVQTDGGFSVRLRLDELQGAAGVSIAPAIDVAVGSWGVDPTTGTPHTNADDWLPSATGWVRHLIQMPAATTTVSSTTTTTSTRPALPTLALKCVGHALTATVSPAGGSSVASVAFYVNGKLITTVRKPPYVATIPTKGLASVAVSATVRLKGGVTQTLRKRARAC